MVQQELDLDVIDDGLDERHLLVQVLHLMREIRDNQIALDDRLWKYTDVAVFLQTSDQNARRVLSHEGAPRPVRVPTIGDSAMPPRYLPEEIREYVKREGRKAPSRR